MSDEFNFLTWRPWIGKFYKDVPQDKKILIVGESHYINKKADSNLLHVDKYFTSNTISDVASQSLKEKTRLFSNIQRILTGTKTGNPDFFGTWLVFIILYKDQ